MRIGIQYLYNRFSMRQWEYAFAAKFYRYGWTDSSEYLLNGTDINKQITYGEYLEYMTINYSCVFDAV